MAITRPPTGRAASGLGMYVCMYVCMHACMHACMHVRMYVCMYVCIYIYIYTYIHIICTYKVGIHYRGVQSEGGAVDGGSIT